MDFDLLLVIIMGFCRQKSIMCRSLNHQERFEFWVHVFVDFPRRRHWAGLESNLFLFGSEI
jgi:hypothetical protein